MLVLIKVGDYLTHRYTSSLELLKKDFDEYTPDHEIVACREDGYYYFEVIPKLIPKEFKYRPGWFYDRPEVRDIFINYKKSNNSYFKAEFIANARNELQNFINSLYSGKSSWGITRIKELLMDDIRTLNFAACPDIVNAGDSIQVKCKQFPRGAIFKIGDCEIVFDNIRNDQACIDPYIKTLDDCIAIQSEIGSRPNIEPLAKSLKDEFTSIIKEKEKSNPYLQISDDNRIDYNTELTKSYGDAQRILLDALWK